MKISGESVSADQAAADEFPDTTKKIKDGTSLVVQSPDSVPPTRVWAGGRGWGRGSLLWSVVKELDATCHN